MSTPIKREAGQEQPRPSPAPPQQQQQRPTVDRPVVAAAAPPPPPQQQQQVIEPVRWKWMSVDSDLFPDVSVPVIMRGPSDEAYISVRITERTVLMRFHNELSAEAMAYGSLTSYPCTPAESNELNEINEVYVDRLYGTERFDVATEKLVKWKEFMEFFAILKRTCRLRTMPPPPTQVAQSNRAANAPTFPQFPAVNPNPALRVSSGANNNTIHATLRGASASVASPNRAAQQIPSIRTTTPPVNTTVFNPPNTTLIARPPQQEINPVVATTSSGYNVISTPNGYKVVPPSPSNLTQHHIASRSVSQPPSQSSPPPQQIQRLQAVNPHLQQLQEMQQLNHLQPRPHPMSAGLVSNQHFPHMFPQQQQQQQQPMAPPPPSSSSPHHLIQLQHHINMQNIQKQQMIQHHLNQQQQMSQSPPNSAQFFPNPNQHTAANVSVIPPPYVASPHRSAPSSPRSHSNGPPSSSSPGALNPPPFSSFPHGYMQQQQHQSPQMSHSSTTMSSPPTGNSASQSIHQIRPHSVAASIYPPGHHQHHVSPSLYSFPHPHHPNAASHLHHPHHPSPLLPPQISGYSPPQQQQQPSTLLPPPPPPSHASIYNQAAAQLQALQHQQNLNNPALRHHLMSNPTPPLTPSPNPNLVVAANPASNTADQILRILGAQQQQQQQQQSHNYNQYANNNRIIAPQIQPQIRTTAQHDQRTTSNIIPQPSTTSANNQQINTSSADEDDIIWLGDDQPITKPTTSSTIVKKIEKTSAPVKSENKTVVMASNSNTSTNQQTQANTRTSTKDRGPMNYLKINTVVVPFVNLEREKAVRLFELIPGSTQFVSAYQLAITGVIPHDLIDDRDRLRANFKSLQMATVAQLDEINKLTRELLAAFNPDAGPRLFLEQLDPGDKRHFYLVNVIELMLAYSSAAMFVREMSLHDTTLAKFNEQSFNFRDVLQMRGGIIQVIAPSTDGQDTSIKILPFVEVGDLLLIKDSIRNYLEELVALRQTESNTDEPKINLSKLVIPMTEQSEEQRLILRTIAEFFQLLLVYVAIPTRISYKMTLINVKPLLSLFPDRLFIICRFTENFPIDWRTSLENIKSNISTNSEGERINSNGNEGEQPIATPTATTTTTTTTVRRSSRNERRDIDDANQMTIELTSSSSEDNNPPEVPAATTNNNQMTIELTSTSSDEDRRENADSSQQPPPMETDENKVTSTTTTLNVDVNNQQNSATTTIISPQPVTTTTTTTTTAATSRFESSVSLSPASIDSPEPTSQFVEKSSSSPPKSKATENTVKSGRTFSISILHQQQKEKEKEKEAAKTVKIVTVERFTEDELKIRPRRRCYSAIYVCRATNTSKDFADWFKAEKWPKVERRILNQHQQQQVSSSEEKGEVVSSPPPCDHYLRRVLHGANPWEVQQSVVNLIQGHNRLAKMYREKEERERESVNKNKPRAASLASEPTSTEDMRPSITSTTNKETEKPAIKQPSESSKPSEMNWEETGGGGSEEPESKTTAVTTTTPKQRGRKRFSSQQSSSTTSTTNANTKKRKRGSRRRFTVKTPKRRRASHETVSYMSRTTTAATRNNSTSESDTSSGGSLKDFIANDDELEYETAEEDLYSSFPDDNEQDEWATATIGKQGAQSSKGIVVTLRRKSKNNPPPQPPLKPNIACIQKDNDLYTSEDPAVDERQILKKMGIFKVAKITDKKLSVTQILAIQRQLKETSNADGSKRQFAKKATSKTPLPTTKDTTITNNKRTVPAKKQTTTTATSPTTRQTQRKILTSTSTTTTTTTTTKQTSKVKSEPTTSRIEKPVSPQSAITISSSSSAASVKPTATTTKTKTTSSTTSLFHDEDSNSLPELAF